MRASKAALALVLTIGFVPARLEAAPAPIRAVKARLQKVGTWLKNTRRVLRNTGVVATVEAQLGVGFSVLGDVGFRITPKDEATGKRKAGLFVSAEGHAFVVGARATTAFDKSLRGMEYKYGPVGHGSPLYGDRISVVLFPEVLSVFAGRSGGLGLRLNLFPLLSGPFAYLGRWGGTIYVTNPALAPAAGWVLDKADRVEAKLKSWIPDPVKDRWNRFRLKFGKNRVASDAPTLDTADTPTPDL